MINCPLPPRDFLLLDGGLATELESRGFDLKHKLWSAKLLLEDPQAILDAHLAYLRAGAQCIISASYQASINGFAQMGLTQAQARDAILLSVSLARQAINRYCDESNPDTRPLLGASIGPYGAHLADGSEYRGNYGLKPVELVDFHREKMALLADSDADFLACETIPSLPEAQALNTLLAGRETPAWVSFSCRNGTHLNDGHLLADAATVFADTPAVFALGVNCTSPRHIISLIDQLKRHTEKSIVVYPNSGEYYRPQSRSWHGTADPQEVAQAAIRWRDRGASIIGGCCRMGPEHIRAMRDVLCE